MFIFFFSLYCTVENSYWYGTYLCEECGKTFNLSSGLLQYKRIHAGVKPYQCKDKCRNIIELAPKPLQRGLKPCDCKECGKAFIVNDEPVQPQKIHPPQESCACKEGKHIFVWTFY